MTSTERIPALPLLSARDRRRCLPDTAELAEGQYLVFDDGLEHELMPIDAGALRIGRGRSVDLSLEDLTVSRRHATIVPDGDGYQLHDDTSTNGTYVNGRRISCVDLVDGDVIDFGHVELLYRDTTPLRMTSAA